MWASNVLIAVTGLLLTGAGSALMRKVLYQLPGVGLHGVVHTFEKPLFTTLDSAVGCSCGLLVHWLDVRMRQRKMRQQLQEQQQAAAADGGERPNGQANGGGAVNGDKDDLTQPLLADKGTGVLNGSSPFLAEGAAAAAGLQAVGADLDVVGGVPAQDDDSVVANGDVSFHRIGWSLAGRLSWPAVLARVSLAIQGCGLRYISASTNQMVAASCIVFTALMSVFLFGKRLNSLHLAGITLTLAGVAMVAFADEIVSLLLPALPVGLMAWVVPLSNNARGPLLPSTAVAAGAQNGGYDGGSGGDGGYGGGGGYADGGGGGGDGGHSGGVEPMPRSLVALGTCLVLLSQVVQAAQLVMEEALIGPKGGGLEPMEVVGWEGLLSMPWMVLLFLPAAQLLPGPDVGGVQENSVDSFVMLAHSARINACNAFYFVTVVGTNLYGLSVASHLGSVFRAVLLAVRTGLVWLFGLMLAGATGGALGETWRGAPSWVTLAGFVLLLAGAVMYAQGSSKAARLHAMYPEVEPQELAAHLSDFHLLTNPMTSDVLGLFDQLEPVAAPEEGDDEYNSWYYGISGDGGGDEERGDRSGGADGAEGLCRPVGGAERSAAVAPPTGQGHSPGGGMGGIRWPLFWRRGGGDATPPSTPLAGASSWPSVPIDMAERHRRRGPSRGSAVSTPGGRSPPAPLTGASPQARARRLPLDLAERRGQVGQQHGAGAPGSLFAVSLLDPSSWVQPEPDRAASRLRRDRRRAQAHGDDGDDGDGDGGDGDESPASPRSVVTIMADPMSP